MALADHHSISETTKQKVRLISRRLGYRPPSTNKPLRSEKGKQRRLGFCLVGGPLEDDVNTPLLMGLSNNARQSDMRLEFAAVESTASKDRTIQEVLAFARAVDLLLLSGMVDHDLLNEVTQAGIPHVLVGTMLNDPADPLLLPVQMVGFDAHRGGSLATASLIRAGFKRIAFVSQAVFPGLNNDAWLDGYLVALIKAGVPHKQEQSIYGKGRMIDLAGALTKALTSKNPPDAFVVTDAPSAMILVETARQIGIHLDPSQMIYGCMWPGSTPPALAPFGALAFDGPLLVERALDLLIQSVERPPVTSCQLLIAPTAVHLKTATPDISLLAKGR